jgi:hypothetical protein
MCRIRLIVGAESEEFAAAIMEDVQAIVILGKTPSSVRRFGNEVRAVFNDLPEEFESEPQSLLSLLGDQDGWAERPGMTKIVAQPVDV